MDEAATLFQKLLDDNNLTVQLTRPEIKYIENGGVIVEPQKLFVRFTNPVLPKPTEGGKEDGPIQPTAGEQATEKVEAEA